MRKSISILSITLLALGLLFAEPSQATDITIFDTAVQGNPSTWYNRGNSPGEDQEVEPNNLVAQKWDLEAFILQGSSLMMVGGYNFKRGVAVAGDLYTRGDIFLDINGDAKCGTPPESTVAGKFKVFNTFGYDYALRLNFADNTYQVFALDSGSRLITVDLGKNAASNPWKYFGRGTRLDEIFSFEYQTGLSHAEILNLYGLDVKGRRHNVVTLDLLALFAALGITPEEFLVHFTYECGNDNLIGAAKLPQVPIPGSLVLLGSGLLALFVLGRRRKPS